MKTYNYGKQHLELDDYLSVLSTLKSPFLTCGPKVKEFEQAICDYTGAKYCVAVNSATSGLHIAMLAATEMKLLQHRLHFYPVQIVQDLSGRMLSLRTLFRKPQILTPKK